MNYNKTFYYAVLKHANHSCSLKENNNFRKFYLQANLVKLNIDCLENYLRKINKILGVY